MTDPALIERITRSLAFMLRHQPETFDLELDSFGYCALEDVVHALNERLGEPVEEEDVHAAVRSGDRQRYEILGDRIRALYGHSIPIEPGPSSKPPEFLFVAVPQQELERARRFGLRGGRRRFLHLATTPEEAAESGRRSARDYTVLVVHALDAWEEGIHFYDRISLWLAEEVPTNLLEVQGSYHDGTDPLPRRSEAGRGSGGERERPEGRGRRRRGRDRDRGHGRRDDLEPAEAPHEARGAQVGDARESEPLRTEPAFARDRGADAGRGRSFGRDSGREGRDSFERPRREEHRAEGRRTSGAREDGRGGRMGPREERPPREERSAPREPSSRPAPAPRAGSGFGAGVEPAEEPRSREARTPPPAPAPPQPPARREVPPADDGRPAFGAGL